MVVQDFILGFITTVENYQFQILHGREAFSNLQIELSEFDGSDRSRRIWNQAIPLSEITAHVVVRNAEDHSLQAFWPFAGYSVISGMGLKALGCSPESPVDPLMRSEDATLLITLMEGVEELLVNFRCIHIPALQKVLTQDILRPYFVRRQVPRKEELSPSGDYSISLYQKSFYGKLNLWLSK